MEITSLTRTYKTGFLSIDGTFAGIMTKSLMVIGSRPAVGKSSLALSLASGLLAHNNEHFTPSVCYFSLDSSKDEICRRWLKFPENLKIDDSAHSIEDICDRITTLSQGFGIKVFFIDYYSKMLNLDTEKKEDHAVQLKKLAVALGVAIVCLEEIHIFKPDKWSVGFRIDKNLCEEADTVLILEKDTDSKIQAHWAKDKMNRDPFFLYQMHDGFFKEIVRGYNYEN